MKKTTVSESMQLILQRYILPHHLLSRLLGFLASSQINWIKNSFIYIFLLLYAVDMQEAEETDPYQYSNFNAFFTRHLKPGARPITNDASAIISPADGIVSQFGTIEHNTLFTAKHATLKLPELLGSETHCQPFEGGRSATIYLAPHNYHRVHMPYTGRLHTMIYIPGRLFSVSPFTVDNIPNLFSKNERIICFFDTDFGPMAIVLIGAMIVASITTRWQGKITPSSKATTQHWDYTHRPIDIKRGKEIAYFELGSTVLVFFPKDRVSWENHLTINTPINMGQTIGTRYQHGSDT